MVINKILNELFSARSNVVVIRAMKNSLVGLTGREISRLSGLSPKTCLETLTNLENLGVVNRIRGGRDHIFSYNRDNYLVKKFILPLMDAEPTYRVSIFRRISTVLESSSVGVYLYGSVARGEETVNSDFDICILYKIESSKPELESLVSKLIPVMYKNYGINVSPFYLSVDEFIKRARNKKSPVPDIIKDGIIISGIPIERLLYGKKGSEAHNK
jgi:predicted nucleotidyltransferase